MAWTLKLHPSGSGQAAEDQALSFLQEQGLALVERNYACKGGELDLVMREGSTLIFVEVRYRKNADYGGASASITEKKQKRILIAAQHYLQQHRHHGPCRIDVMAATQRDITALNFEWLKNAITY